MKHEVVASAGGLQRLTVLAAFVMFMVGVWVIPIGHDQVWAVWIGRQMVGGATLYRDIIEVNPPLWFWLAVPQAALGLEAATTVRLFFALSIALSLYLIPAKYRLPSLVAFALLPLTDFGQREHFTLIATAPYVFLCAQRLRGEQPRHAVLIGLLAAFGLALKPYFVIVPILLELALWQLPRFRRETIALGACAILYAGAVPLFAPDYLSEIVPQVVQYYGHFHGGLSYGKFVLAIALAVAGAAFGRRSGSPESRLLALTALAFLPAVLLQAKGWSYQTIPVRGFLFLAIVVELMRSRGSAWADSFLVASAILCCAPFGTYRNINETELGRHLDGLQPGTTITAITSNPSMVWPMIEDRGLVWTSRQFCTWQIFAAKDNRARLQTVRGLVAAEIARRPQIIVVDRRRHIAPTMERLLPTVPKGYELRKRTPRLETYEAQHAAQV